MLGAYLAEHPVDVGLNAARAAVPENDAAANALPEIEE